MVYSMCNIQIYIYDLLYTQNCNGTKLYFNKKKKNKYT